MTTARRWRLRGFPTTKKADNPSVDKVCHGDRALDEALRDLEHDPKVARITAELDA